MESLPGHPDTQKSPSTLPTLDQVHAQFQQWRSTRKYKGKAPPALWGQVFLLLGRYREANICNKLGILNPGYKQLYCQNRQNMPKLL
jgi:hypothetical protein